MIHPDPLAHGVPVVDGQRESLSARVRRFVLETHQQRFQLPASWFKLGADGVLVQPVNSGKNDSEDGDHY